MSLRYISLPLRPDVLDLYVWATALDLIKIWDSSSSPQGGHSSKCVGVLSRFGIPSAAK